MARAALREARLEDCDENKSSGVSHQAGRDALVRPKRGAEQVVNAVRGLANFARQRVLYGRVHLPADISGTGRTWRSCGS